MTRLPSEGRKGPTPTWPLSRIKLSEKKIWDEIWQTPQAAAWEQLGWERTVARYVRLLVEAEKSKAPATVLAEARQLEDRLGLHPMSMLRLRWEIVPDEVQEKREEQPSVRRLEAVEEEAANG
jgi:hypothetical protein